MRMSKRTLFLFVGIVVALVSGTSAQAPKGLEGTWKLNVAKSKFSPGPAPKEMTLTIEAAGPGRKVSVTGVDGEGKPIAWGYTGNFDSKQNRLTGSNPDADFVAYSLIATATGL